MGGHDHVEVPKVPDWRIYRVEDVPELQAVQKALSRHGLRDNWLRNEVWKYTEIKYKYPPLPTYGKQVLKGLKYGLLAAVVTTILEKTFIGSHHGHHDDDKSH